MVQKGQFLERPALIRVGDQVLEGLSHRGGRRPALLIVPPLPGDGSMDHVVAAEVAWAAATAGFPTLRFNFRGSGASQGDHGPASSRRADVHAALALLEENVQSRSTAILAIGSSALDTLAVVSERDAMAGYCCVSPVGLEAAELMGANVPLLVIAGALESQVPWAAVTDAGGSTDVISGADASFLKNLPEVGKSVVRWLRTLSPSD